VQGRVAERARRAGPGRNIRDGTDKAKIS
jgi:hypothetical protein